MTSLATTFCAARLCGLLDGCIGRFEVLEVLERTVVVSNGNLLGLGNDFSVDETFVQVQAYPYVAGSECFRARKG